jgi:branched-chain amino acid transport system ATP-binding protein
MGDVVLKISDLVVDYGIIRAIKGIDLEIEKGKIVAILGANGAGKSSVIRTINGLVKPKSGKILFEDENISGLNPHKIAKKGIIQSPEGRHIFKGLTVEENLMVGAYSLKAPKGESTKKLKQQILDQVYTYFPVLKERRKQQASTLSGGEQQMLAIGRALMAKPKLLLLDEPSLGLAPMIVKDIFRIITEIKAAGNTILLVEQNAFQTLKIADEVYVMELGKIKTKGTAEELLKDEQLVEAYLGKK